MILLDTHAWIWWVTKAPQLSPRAVDAIKQADSLGVHVISCWEVSMLTEKGRISFNKDVGDWVKEALTKPKITLVNFEPNVAVCAARLKDFHGDPADRIIVATCLINQIPLVSKDNKIRSWQQIEVIW